MSEVATHNSPIVGLSVSQPAAFRKADVAKLATGAGISLVGKITGRGLHVLGQIVLARLLGPEAFGLYGIGWTILRMVGLLSPLGLHRGVIRYASLYRHEDASRLKGVLVQSVGLAMLSGGLIGGSLYLAAPWLAESVFQKPGLVLVIRWFSPAFALYAGLRVAATASTISRRMKYSIYTQEFIQPSANLLLVFAFSFVGWKLAGAVAAGAISFGLALIFAIYYARQLFPELSSKEIKPKFMTKELLAFSLPASLAGVFSMGVVWVDRLLIGYFRPAADVGIYQAVSQSAILFAIILSAFSSIFTPMIADLYHKKELGRLEELFRVSTKWGLYISLPLFLVICAAPREMMTVVFDARYEDGWLSLVILALGQLVNVGTGSIGDLLVMTGRQKLWFSISGATLVANIILNCLFVPRWGLAGAALGTACALGGMFVIGLLQVRHHLKIWPYDRRYLKGMLASLTAVGVLVSWRWLEVSSPALNLLACVAIAVGIFAVMLWLLGLDREDKEFMQIIRTRFKLGLE